MSKIILFITNSGDQPFEESILTTTINNYISYFKSPYGGSWTDQEIFYLHQPDLQTLSSSLEAVSQYSLSLIIFCGPAYQQEDTYTLKINQADEVDSKELFQNYSRYIVIVDNCAQINCEDDLQLFENLQPFTESLHAMLLNRWECKNYYNTINIEKCPNQWIGVYSLQTPVSQKLGSYYAAFLLKQARLMVGTTYEAIDFTKSFGHVRFPMIHQEVLTLISSYKTNIPELKIVMSEDTSIEESLVFSVLA